MTAVLGTVYFAVGGGGTDIGSFPGDDTGQAKTVSDFNLRNHHVRCSISLKNTAARPPPPVPSPSPPPILVLAPYVYIVISPPALLKQE